MAKLNRTFSFLVNNPTARKIKISVVVSPASAAQIASDTLLRELKLPPLKLSGFGILPHDCGLLLEKNPPKPKRSVSLELPAGESVELMLVVRIQGPLPRQQAVQVLHIAEKRAGAVLGGITVVIAAHPQLLRFSPIVEPNPAPLKLEGPLVSTLARYSGDASESMAIAADATDILLGAMIGNRGNNVLKNIELHVESTNCGTLRFDPLIFQVAELGPGEHFFAATPADVARVAPGAIGLTFRGIADGYGPVRLQTEIQRLAHKIRYEDI